MTEPLTESGLAALLAELRDDPSAQRRLRAGYSGDADPLAVLRWRLDPGAEDSPLREVPTLERVVHSRNADPVATTRLRGLTESYRNDQAALDVAITRYLEPDVRPAPPAVPWYRRRVLWFIVGGVAVAALLVYGLLARPVDSRAIFDRPQTLQELEFADGQVPFGAARASFRLLRETENSQIWVARIAEDESRWRAGAICLYEQRMTSIGGGSGTCVPAAQFEQAGIWMYEGGVDPRVLYGWGPTGEQLRIIDTE